nr:F-box only protein 38-like [Lytechinus pictus]
MPKAKSKSVHKRMKTRMSRGEDSISLEDEDLQTENILKEDFISQLSLELLEKIFCYLPVRTVISCERLNHHFQLAVLSYLNVVKEFDLTEHKWYGYIPRGFCLSSFTKLLKRCPKVEVIRGLHIYPEMEGLHRHLNRSDQMMQGMVKELKKCSHLRQVEISSLDLADALVEEMPELDLGDFSNRGSSFEADCRPYFTLIPDYHIRKLHLTGVTLPELPQTPHVQEIILEWVELTSSQPFQNFVCPALRTFVMRNCFGPLNALKYVALIDNLARCLNLERLELVRVPFLGGLIQHTVEESAGEQYHGFRNLKTIIISGCKNCTEQDLGHLLLAADKTLESLSIQPCLTRDSLFLAFRAIECKFLNLKNLHLGYVDPWSNSGKYTSAELISKGLVEINENPAVMTDMGMKAMGQVLPNLTSLTVYNCPHLRYPRTWLDVEPVDTCWSQLTSLHLRHCHRIQLNDYQSLSHFIEWLPNLEDIYLERMFPNPPKGCSRVGLSAGTGIGVSSALVAMQNPGAQRPPQHQNEAEVPVPDVAPINQEAPRQQQGNADRGHNRQIQDGPQQNMEQVQLEEPERQSNQIQPAIDLFGIPDDHLAGPSDITPPNRNTSEELPLNQQLASSSSNAISSRNSGQASTSIEAHRTLDDSEESIHSRLHNKKDSSTSLTRSTYQVEIGSRELVSRDNNRNEIDQPSESHVNLERTTPKKNFRDASTSAMSMAGSCPIHGTMMQDLSNDDDEDDEFSSLPSMHDKFVSAIDGPCNSVGVQVHKDAQSSPLDSTPMMCDQATSTSDPVMEADPVLVFRCASDSLISATFNDCGISHIEVQDCPNLVHIQGHHLPIFKKLSLSNRTSRLSKVQFEQCPKMEYGPTMDELMLSCARTGRVVRLRPMSRMAIDDITGAFENKVSSLNHNALLIMDHTTPPQAHHSSAVWDWVNILSGLNQTLLFERNIKQAYRSALCGDNEEGVAPDLMVFEDEKLKVMTDLPWMKPLLESNLWQLGVPPSCGKNRHESIKILRERLAEPIAMAIQEKQTIFPSIFCIYIQTSDQDGAAMYGEFTTDNR